MKVTLKHALSVLLLAIFLLLVLFPFESLISSEVSLGEMLLGPSATHPLGTDNLGRDVLLRFSSAVKLAVLPVWAGVVGGFLLGLVVVTGLIALSYLSVVRFVLRALRLCGAVVTSIPLSLTIFFLAVSYGGNEFMFIVFAIMVFVVFRTMLMVNDLFDEDSNLGFWQANQALGGSQFWRLWRYGVFLSWRKKILESLIFQMQIAVTIEAMLSYLGFGVQEPSPSFGNMLASHMELYLRGDMWILIVIVFGYWMTTQVPQALGGLLLEPSRVQK